MTAVSVETFFDEATFTATHLVWDPRTRKAAIIDPVLDLDMRSGRVWDGSVNGVLAAAEAKGLQIHYVLETHAHADHLSAAQIVKKRTGAEILIGAGIAQVIDKFTPLFALPAEEGGRAGFDRLVNDQETLPLGELSIMVVATPGHTPACVSYNIADALFVGDTLFMPVPRRAKLTPSLG
jgi:glyoxylase-like metal-dependent hydrolase (beta-lactamase superfamily II)